MSRGRRAAGRAAGGPRARVFRWRREAAVGALLAALVCAVYAPVRGHAFIECDDPDYIYQNDIVRAGLGWRGVAWAFTTGHASNWHPLTWLSHMFDSELFGPRPGAHHAMGAALHLANALLLFGAWRAMTGRVWRSAAVAAAFAVHPLHVESVAWVAERKDVLCGFWWMAAMSAYAWHARRPSPGRLGAVAACLAAALMSKPMAVTLPFVLLLLDVWPLRRLPPAGSGVRALWPLLREKVPLLVLAAASAAVTYAVQRSGASVMTIEQVSWPMRIGNALVSYVAYAAHMLWPVRLCFFYPHRGLVSWAEAAGAAVLLAGLTAAAVWAARRKPYAAVGWFWYLGTLVPVIGLVQAGEQAMADRYAYLPLIGLYLVLVWGAGDLLERRRRGGRAAIALAALALLPYATLARRQVGLWKDGETLFTHALATGGESPFVHNHLGAALRRKGDLDRAAVHFGRAVELSPGYTDARFNFALALAKRGRHEEAAAQFRLGLAREPGDALAHAFLGMSLGELGDHAGAAAAFREALARSPGDPAVMSKLGLALERQGLISEAVRQYRAALAVDPRSVESLGRLAWILATDPQGEMRNGEEAAALAQRGCAAAGRPQAVLLDILAAAQAEAGRFDEAAARAAEALDLARRSKAEKTARDIEVRLNLYRQGKPFHRPAAP
jgi:tetratricopeptide (TPR) repeat protein